MTIHERFRSALEGVGGQTVWAADLPAATAAVTAAIRQRGIEEVAAWADPLFAHMGLFQAIADAGIGWFSAAPGAGREEIRSTAARVGAGITTADLAVAETGTLVLTTAPGRPRSFTLLPPLHIAVLTVDQLVPDTEALFSHLSNRAQVGQMPSALYMITGPSKTRDIEHIPVRKVHGPGELLVVLIAGAMS